MRSPPYFWGSDHPAGSHSASVRRAVRTSTLLAAASVLLAISACTGGGEVRRESDELQTDVVDALEELDEYDKVRAVLVNQGGENTLELWRGDDAHAHINLRSITKSVLSTLVGIAMDQGLIAGVDATLGSLLPAQRAAMTPEVEAIPLDAILSHTAGFAPDTEAGGSELEFWTSPDWIAAIVADRVARGPSDGGFAYSSAGSHVLAAILDEATDGSVLDFARENLFEPLGIDTDPAWAEAHEGDPEELSALAEEYDAAEFAWPTDPQGVQQGDSLLKLTPDDLLTFGLLFLHDGGWDGVSVVPSEWIEASTTSHVDIPGGSPNGYGYQWWVDDAAGDRMYLALGYAGNVVAVVPDRDLVAVIVSEFELSDPSASSEELYTGEALALLETAILPHTD